MIKSLEAEETLFHPMISNISENNWPGLGNSALIVRKWFAVAFEAFNTRKGTRYAAIST